MDDPLQTLEHAQNTAIDLATQYGPRVQIAARPWTNVDACNKASSDITQTTLETFRARGIVIPLPQQEVPLLGTATEAGTA